jgi:DNA polymerase elongation subunit (family B)
LPELVSGWSDDDGVYLVERDGERVSARRLPARWSAFVGGMNEADRKTLQRSRDVVSLSVEPNGLTRIDFKNRWARKESIQRIGEAIKLRKFDAAMYNEDPLAAQRAGVILEADVQPLRRLLSDVPTIQIGNPRPAYLDLEVDSRKTFDEMKTGKARILAWALYADSGAKLGSAVLEADSDDAERALLRGLFEALESVDVVLAWNGDGFDFPVLEMRTSRLRVKLRTGKVPTWNRWCWLDHMEVFKKYNQAHDSGEERASFSLNAIAQHVCGEGKTEFDAKHTWASWAAGGEERGRLLAYCEQDTGLMPKIEAKTGFVALHIAVCQVTRCFPDSASLGAAQQGDGFLLALGTQRGFRFPTRRAFDEEEEHQAFLGAYVMAPKRTGVIDDVHVCDFAGLYPSIMRSWNMSPDTLLAPRDRSEVAQCRLPDRDVRFRTDRRGIFPEALDLIVSERARYTKRSDDAEPGSDEWSRYKRLSSAYKIIANSFYGIVGSPFTRYFDRTIAEGVTQTGAWLIKHVAATSERAGLDPFYGDTDSVFVQGDAARFSKVVESLNDSWPATLRGLGCTESRIKLEYEKSFRRLVLVSAKRYAARYALYKGKPAPADMKPEVKGLEYKRGDALRLTREMQKEAIDILLDVDGPTPTPATFREFVERWRVRVLEGELAAEDIILSQSVKALGEYVDRYTSPRCTGKVEAATAAGKKGKKSCGFEYGSNAIPPDVLREMREGKPEEEIAHQRCPRCKAVRKLASHPAHVRVAKLLAARGEPVMAGTRIEYLIVGRPEDDESGDDKMNAVPAHDPGAFEKIDRDYYWDKRILPPTARLLEAVWPHERWKETAASRARAEKAAAKEAAKAERKRDPRAGVADLPLFSAHDPHGTDAADDARVAVADALRDVADAIENKVRGA